MGRIPGTRVTAEGCLEDMKRLSNEWGAFYKALRHLLYPSDIHMITWLENHFGTNISFLRATSEVGES